MDVDLFEILRFPSIKGNKGKFGINSPCNIFVQIRVALLEKWRVLPLVRGITHAVFFSAK